MQFKVITIIVFFFAAQTMATPSLQTRDDATAAKRCTLAFMDHGFVSKAQTNHVLLRLPQAMTIV